MQPTRVRNQWADSLREMRCLKARETLTGQEVRDESGADIEIRNTHT
jgi:hypothetical protein